VLKDTDRSWLKELNEELYPPKDERSPMEQRLDDVIRNSKDPIWAGRKASLPPPPKKPRELLTSAEVLRIFEIVRDSRIVAEPLSHGLFGGIAIRLWDHEQYIGTGPEPLLCVTDRHLPEPTTRSWHKKLLGRVYEGTGKIPGGIRDDAWDLVMLYSKVDHNVSWLKQYRLNVPRDRVHYEY